MEYKMSLWGSDKMVCFDYVQDEVIFSVIETDFFNTGSVPRAKQHGYLLLKIHFEILYTLYNSVYIISSR